MKRRHLLLVGALTLATLLVSSIALAQDGGPQSPSDPAEALTTGFTYQGRLDKDGSPVNDTCNLGFRLYDAATMGTQVGSTINTAVPVTDGLFSVSLDFGASAFNGDRRWLGVEVDCEEDGTYDNLGRQELTAAPHALYAAGAPWSGLTGVPAGFADGVDNVGPGGDGWSLTGNSGTTPGTHFLGTSDDQALELHVNGTRALRLEPHGGSPNLIAGSSANTITAGASGAVIGGGGGVGLPNRVTDSSGTIAGGVGNLAGDDAGITSDAMYATVGGGYSNQATSDFATVDGGRENEAAGYATTVGGGESNTASGNGYATIGGGYGNEATDYSSTVGGGYDNIADANYATISGGRGNVVISTYSTVGGGYQNTVSNDYAVVGGGRQNTVNTDYAVIGGGYQNIVSSDYAVVGGGRQNTVNTDYAVIGGGRSNTADNIYATIAGGQLNVASGMYGTVPGGDRNEAAGDYSFAAGHRAKANHRGSFVWADFSNTSTDFSSTAEDQFLVRASGGVVFTTTLDGALLRLDPHATSPNLIGGHSDNTVSAGAYGATIGGGGVADYPNRVTDDYGTVGGGYYNLAGDNTGTTSDALYATVGGGYNNEAYGYATVGGGAQNHATGLLSTVGGGSGNQATQDGATVGGGDQNQATADYATTGGGQLNEANGQHATVPGGNDNTAGGDYSFAAGRLANASHQGAFVWADSTMASFGSQRNNQFRVRANGGARFDVNGGHWVEIYDDGINVIDTFTGARLTTGGVWTDSSDRNLKENFVAVDGREVLAHLAEVPITTWSYKAQDPSVRHLGPVAQDFYAAFELGEDDRHIAALDTSGVALAAAQGLYDLTQEQAVHIETLEAENASLQQQVDDLEARVAALEQPTKGIVGFTLSGWWVLAGLAIVIVVAGWRWRHGGGR